MPTYQYACTSAGCGHRFERVQAFTDPAVSECPSCGLPVRKVYGSVGVVFKGSGFYRNDSRAAASAASEKSRDGAGKAGAKEGKSESASKADGNSSSSSSPSSSSSSSSEGGSGTTTKAAASA